MSNREIAYLPVRKIAGNPKNPKDHDIGALHQSMDRFGYVEPVVLDERTGMLVSGHGRVETLAQREQAGQEPPEGIDVDEQGNWLIPVVRGWASENDDEANAFIVAANQLTTLGGWHEDELIGLLAEIADSPRGLEGVGYDDQDLQKMLESLEDNLDVGDAEEEDFLEIHAVIVQCRDEQHQAEVLEMLAGQGYKVRAVMS